MAIIKANHSKAGNFDVLPAGTYEVIIDAGQFKKAGSGSDMIVWKLKVRDDVEAQSQFKGRILFSNLVFLESTEGIVQSFIKAIGTPDGMEFNSYDDLIKYATGKAVSVKVIVKPYNGDDTNEVKSISEPKVAGGKVDDPFMNVADPLGNGGNYTKVKEDPFAQNNGPIEVSDDDLPF